MICKNDIMDLKQGLAQNVGRKIIVKGSLGRSKTYEEEAIIENTYPNLFTVKYGQNVKNLPSSYSYTDVLTRTVEVALCNESGVSSIIPASIRQKLNRKF